MSYRNLWKIELPTEVGIVYVILDVETHEIWKLQVFKIISKKFAY